MVEKHILYKTKFLIWPAILLGGLRGDVGPSISEKVSATGVAAPINLKRTEKLAVRHL